MCHSSHTDKRNAPNDDGMNTEPKAKQQTKNDEPRKVNNNTHTYPMQVWTLYNSNKNQEFDDKKEYVYALCCC